jgi:metal-responsive CopG/Arc/MetJ family transcriptional regulator
MKHIVSLSLDQTTIVKIEEILRNTSFRNKSHAVEEAIKSFWEARSDG